MLNSCVRSLPRFEDDFPGKYVVLYEYESVIPEKNPEFCGNIKLALASSSDICFQPLYHTLIICNVKLIAFPTFMGPTVFQTKCFDEERVNAKIRFVGVSFVRILNVHSKFSETDKESNYNY